MVTRTSGPRIEFTGLDALAESLQTHDQKVKRYIAAQFLRAEGEATAYAKKNAPWGDISGNARAGLHSKAIPINQGQAFELIVAHSVFYGIYLESRFSGKFAILMPTINYIGKLLIDRIAAGLDKIQ